MILDRLVTAQPRASVTISPWDPDDDRWYGSPTNLAATFAGFTLGPEAAMRVSAVFACNSLIAETVASLPCILYRRLDNGGKERAKDHPLYRTVRFQPNDGMTAMDFFGMGQTHVGLRGAIVNEIVWTRRGVQLLPLDPKLVTTEQLPSGRLRHRVRDPKTGTERLLTQDEVLHVRDLTMNGIEGMARATLAREAIAVAAAGEAFVGGFFKNDATGRLVITHKGAPPKKELRDEMREEFARQYAGWANRSKAMTLWNDASVSEVGREVDGNFIIDPRKFQVSDVARFWRVPGFMIGLEEKSTSWGSGIEQQKQGFVDFTIRPWLTRWEQAMARDLLTEDEQEEYFFEFLTADLLRGDLKSRMEAYKIGREIGMFSPNDLLKKENETPREGGDTYQESIAGASPNPSPAAPPPPTEAPQAQVPSALLQDAAGRIAAAETGPIEKRAGKAKTDGLRFMAWARDFFRDQRAYTERVLAPLAAAFAVDAWVIDQAVTGIERTGVAAMGAEGPDPGWVAGRADEIATLLDDTFRAGAAVRRAA